METLFNCSLWGDEAFSAVLAQRPFFEMIGVVAKDTSPPLFYIIMWSWFKIFGSSEIAIRSLTLLFYLGTITLVYLISKKLYNKKTAILSVLLTFFNPFLFPYAFEGRMYFSLLFFTVLSFYFLVSKNRWGYILAAAAAIYSHHFAFLVLFAQFLWLIFDQPNKKNILKTIKDYLIIGVLYIPWLYPLYLQTSLVSEGFWLGKPKPADLVNIFINFLNNKPLAPIHKITPLLAGTLLALRKWQKKDLLLVFWLTIPPIVAFGISQTSLKIFYERYLLYCVPPLAILLASRWRKISLLLIAILAVFYLQISYAQFTKPFKKPFREFSDWIKNNSSDISIINYNGGAHHLWETKYYQINAPIYSPGGELPFFVGTAQMKPEDVIYQLPEKNTIGVVTSDDPQSVKIAGYTITEIYRLNSLSFLEMDRE